ncbi:hypothetical protein [Thiospirochaeta perfilievii]|uniref:hypothetical protein n=1 Tax=Thiospirochaeta perfilievii TaxID=252967 RepID=UPI00165973D0|nr:hypothetical protein [Thiospirochaeta perfilievii]
MSNYSEVKHNKLYRHTSGAEIYFEKQERESEYFVSLGFKTSKRLLIPPIQVSKFQVFS